jgi:hypothetical protein
MLNRLDLYGAGEAKLRDPGSIDKNYVNDGTDMDTMGGWVARTRGWLVLDKYKTKRDRQR